MQYKLLGRSGLRVSELCLGCATFGTNWGTIGSDRRESRRIFDAFAEAGGNFIDTSNRYQEGQSEEFLGELRHEDCDRLGVIGCLGGSTTVVKTAAGNRGETEQTQSEENTAHGRTPGGIPGAILTGNRANRKMEEYKLVRDLRPHR